MSWRETVRPQLLESGLFGDVQVIGGKLRAMVSDSIFLDVYYDPTTGSYSYGLIDLSALSPKDKRVLGWDDCPHPDESAMVALNSYPHHHHRKPHDALVTTASFRKFFDIRCRIASASGSSHRQLHDGGYPPFLGAR